MNDLIKIGVTGGRFYNDRDRVYSTLDDTYKRYPNMLLIAGGAAGADTLAEEWADDRLVPKLIFHAKWKLYGRKAGPIRNRQMADFGIKFLIAFPGNVGTQDMMNYCQSKGIMIWKR